MENHFLVFGANEMIDYVGSRGIATGIAEPFGAYQALDYRGRRVDPTIAKITLISIRVITPHDFMIHLHA